jgi:uncharacterized cupredoxin-like copper-binding protein
LLFNQCVRDIVATQEPATAHGSACGFGEWTVRLIGESRRPLLITVVVLFSGASWAAPSPPTATEGARGRPEDVKRIIRMEATDSAFSLHQIRVRAGETVRFVITNSGFNVHEFAIATPEENAEHRAMMRQMPHMTHIERNVVTVAPGETKELIWRFGTDRHIEFSCNIDHHAEDGMKGAFLVRQ